MLCITFDDPEQQAAFDKVLGQINGITGDRLLQLLVAMQMAGINTGGGGGTAPDYTALLTGIETNTGNTDENTDGLETLIGTTNTSIGATNTALALLHTDIGSTNAKLDTVNTSIGTTNTTLTSTNTKLDTINTSIGTTNTTLTSTNVKLDTLHTDIGTTNTTLTSTNTKLDTVNTNLGTINTSIGTTNTSIASSNTKLDTLHADLTGGISVGGFAANPSASFTRPADTTQYAVNDLVANNTTAGSVSVPSVAGVRTAAGSALIRRVKLHKSGTSLTSANFRIHFFKTAPTVANGDNGVFSPNNVANYCGAMDVTMTQALSDGAVGFGVPTIGSEIIIKLASGTSFFMLIEALNTYTPVSAEVFTITPEVVLN